MKTRTKVVFVAIVAAIVGFILSLSHQWTLAWPVTILAIVLMVIALVMQNRDLKRGRESAKLDSVAKWNEDGLPEAPVGLWAEFQDGTRREFTPEYKGVEDGVFVWRVKIDGDVPIKAMGAEKIPGRTGISWLLPGDLVWRHP